MRKASQVEITAEIADLCREKLADLIVQLNYYRASAYKKEAAQNILEMIAHIEALVLIVSPDLGLEPFLDFSATAQNGNLKAQLGECLFSRRVLQLAQDFTGVLDLAKRSAHALKDRDFARLLRENHHHVTALCPAGVRSWPLLQGTGAL